MFKKFIPIIILISVTLISYVNILGNDFAYDDRDFFIDWPQIKSSSGLPAYLSVPDLLKGDLPLSHRGVYRPIRSMYYLASYSMWGEDKVWGYHLQAIIIHTLIVITIYFILRIITQKGLVALFASILFATHPIHTEAITYTAASLDSLGILFFFLSFYLYLRFKITEFRKKITIFASLIYAFLAFFTYEMTLVLPLMLILYDLYSNNFSFKKLRPTINIYKYFFFLIAVYVLIRFVIIGLGNRADYLGIGWTIAANQARVEMPEIFANYLLWLIFPINFSVIHDVPTNILNAFLALLYKIDPSGNLTAASTNIAPLFPIFYALIVLVLIYLLLRKYPIYFFGSAWIIISLLPVSDIIPQGAIMAERYLYIPSFGFCLMLGYLFYQGYLKLSINSLPFLKYGSYLVILLLLATLTWYSFLTIKRNTDWKNEESIWLAALKVHPQQLISLGALANVYMKLGQYDQAVKFFKEGLKLDPTNVRFNSNLGLALEKKGEIDQAIFYQKEALKAEPNYYFAHIYLGNIYTKQDRFEEAESEYLKALEIKKNDYQILTYLGDVYYNQKKYDEAKEYYEKAFSFNPNSASLAYKIGLAYFQLQQFDKAIEVFKAALELNPKDIQTFLALADTYLKKGDQKKALQTLEEGIRISNNQTLKDRLIDLSN